MTLLATVNYLYWQSLFVKLHLTLGESILKNQTPHFWKFSRLGTLKNNTETTRNVILMKQTF